MTRNVIIYSTILTLALVATSRIAEAFPKGTFKNFSTTRNISNEPLALSGKVTESMSAGGYTYISLDNKGKKSWVAVPQMDVTVGQIMSFSPGTEMQNFNSKKLNRTFEIIVFSGGPIEEQVSNNSSAQKVSGGSDTGDIKVEKATGSNAFSVAELYNKKKVLNKQKVTVRGKVVKVSSGIMGKTWVHLRDGSGSNEKSTNDLTVTTLTVPNDGDVITVTGVLNTNKDFGAGYKYDLIIEEAVIQK